jgi:hypothetical protein
MRSGWRSRGAAFTAAGAALLAAWALDARPAGAEAITGVCPDGSIYIVQNESQVPCSRSKRIEPHEVPPLRPEYLPSPYTWHVWQQRENPNNPYNLIDAARQVQGLQAPPPAGGGPGAARAGVAAGHATPPPVSSPPPGFQASAPPPAPRGPLDLGLSDEELRDLFLIVELSQASAPARFRRETADGRGVFEVSLAHSAAFETQLREAWASRGGLDGRRVLIFTALSKQPESFHANLTFVQGHLTYQPDGRDPRQLGILQGRLGELEAGEAVLGYLVLPETMSLDQQLDVYWNDRRTTVRFEGPARG